MEKKADSTFEPDFCAQRLKDNPWIVQPFEKYEEIRVQDLIKKHKELRARITQPLKFLNYSKTKLH